LSWADDHLAATTYATLSTTVGAGVPTVFYNKRFLEVLTDEVLLYKFLNLTPLPEGNGATVEWTRPRPLSPATTALTEGLNPNASKLYFQKVSATLKEYGDWSQISSLVQQAHLSRDILGAVETFARQAASSMDLWAKKEYCSNGIYPLCADLSTTSKYQGTLTTVTSTTSMASTGLAANTNYGDQNDDLNQSVMVMLTGPAKGEARTVTDYATSGGVITLTTGFTMTPEVGDTFLVVTPDEITTADDLSYANMKEAATILRKQFAQPFNKGLFACIASPDQLKNLMDDTDWKAINTYKEYTDGIVKAKVGEFAGFEVYQDTVPFAFPLTASRGTAGTAGGPGSLGANYSSSGTVQTALCFGRGSMGGTAFARKVGKALKPPVRVKYSNQYATSDPLDRYATVGWVIEAAFKSLWAPHCVGLWTYYQ
jgi:hypothetical protein